MTIVDYKIAARSARYLLDDIGFSKGRPVLVIGNSAARDGVLDALSTDLGVQPVSLNIALADALSESEQKADLPMTIAGFMPGAGPLLLDRIRLLMLPQLRVNAVDVLCRVARRRPVCVSWPGRLESGRLKYAHPDHPECLDEDVSRVAVIDLSINEGPER